jgi:glutamate mutase epsilon subunit
MPTATFGDVIKAARMRDIFAPETLSVLEKLYALANDNFRHGMTEPFKLGAPEVEFVYVSCMAGILLFIRQDGKSKL